MLPGRPEDRSPGAAALPEDPEDLGPGTAAERTRLAWERTAITFGAVVSVTAYLEWRRTQTALRRSEPMPQSMLPRILVGTITGVAALSAVVLLVSAAR